MMYNKLEVGTVYKYKELCEVLNEKVCDGTQKKAQLKEWACHFSWEYPINKKTKKPSKSMLITEIFDTAKEKVDLRINNGGARENAGNTDTELNELFCKYIYSFLDGKEDYEWELHMNLFVQEILCMNVKYDETNDYKSEINRMVREIISNRWASACKILGVDYRDNEIIWLIDTDKSHKNTNQRIATKEEYNDWKQFKKCLLQTEYNNKLEKDLHSSEKDYFYSAVASHMGCDIISRGLYATISDYEKFDDATALYGSITDNEVSELEVKIKECIIDRIEKKIAKNNEKYTKVVEYLSEYPSFVDDINDGYIDVVLDKIEEDLGIKCCKTIVKENYYGVKSVQYHFAELMTEVEKMKNVDVKEEVAEVMTTVEFDEVAEELDVLFGVNKDFKLKYVSGNDTYFDIYNDEEIYTVEEMNLPFMNC